MCSWNYHVMEMWKNSAKPEMSWSFEKVTEISLITPTKVFIIYFSTLRQSSNLQIDTN